ncbi:putative disease resistance protein RGA3 [Nicotiana tomentosiformis]|uniref:putative disease resistance protein RGA3 n=1 Tax=Nicotiana tomentosiformis TaxID=4098 RepID=UPI00388CDF06
MPKLIGKKNSYALLSSALDESLIIGREDQRRKALEMLSSDDSKLLDQLRHKKFLLILDDFWSEEYADWDNLCAPFKVGYEGSKIILTTRSAKVSSVVGANSLHLSTLSDEDCWEIVKQKAFFNTQLLGEDNLEEMRLDIARKCKGLPLASKILGG